MKHNSCSTGAAPQPGTRLWPKALFFAGIIAAWYGLSRVLPLEAWLLGILSWVEGTGVWGPVLFMLLYMPSCVLMVPDVLPNAAAGAIWGVGIGGVAVLFGRALGSAATFLLVRNISREWVERRLATDPRFNAMAEAVGHEGFRIVALLRLCPLFPAIMLNYTLGLTRVSLGAYIAGTLVGMIPRTLFVAYLGSGARSLADLAAGETAASSIPPVLYWSGLVVTLVVVVLLANKARKLIDEAMGMEPVPSEPLTAAAHTRPDTPGR